ncbi:MAG: SMC-Scp complex subunit ScpB [Candidatus Diapherotrites archaeon]
MDEMISFEEKKENLKKLIEAGLFLAPGTVSLAELSKTAKASLPEIRISLNELIQVYSERDTALEIISSDEGYRLSVKEEFEPQVSHFASSPEMHKGVLKTLALIAFKQPVKQSEIIKLRNSKAYEHIKILKEKQFIKKEKKGITSILTTTKKFVDYFGDSIKKKQLQGEQVENAEEFLNELEGKTPENKNSDDFEEEN